MNTATQSITSISIMDFVTERNLSFSPQQVKVNKYGQSFITFTTKEGESLKVYFGTVAKTCYKEGQLISCDTLNSLEILNYTDNNSNSKLRLGRKRVLG